MNRDCNADRAETAACASLQAPWAFLLIGLLFSGVGCSKPPEPQTAPVVRRERRARPPIAREELAVTTASESSRSEPEPSVPATPKGRSSETEWRQALTYTNDRIRRVPWSVNLLKIDRTRPDLALTTTAGRGRTLGLSTLSDQIEAIPADLGQPVAAVNGDFYRTEHDSYAGDPRGLQIMRGELLSAPTGKTAFWVEANGTPRIGNVTPQFEVTWPGGEKTPFGLNEERESNDAVLYTPRGGASTRARGGRELVLIKSGESSWLPLRPGESYQAVVKDVRESGNTRLSSDSMVLSIGPSLVSQVPKVKAGDVLTLSTATSPDLKGVLSAIGGGPVLVRGGKVQPTKVSKAYERHPRTAMGWNDTHYFFMQVDGRQPGFSIGMTLPEVAAYLASHGCQEAMNLDGGGSAEMWVDGQVVNRPCFGYERETANALVVVKQQKPAERQASTGHGL